MQVSQVWFREFGFVSLPLLALVACSLVIALLLIPSRTHPQVEEPGVGEG